MSACKFTMSSINPNEAVGGGGCLCNPIKGPDQAGPYALFYCSETAVNLSPHVVVCAGCAVAIAAAVEDGDELLVAGEADEVPVNED